jgi:hypothetical protein
MAMRNDAAHDEGATERVREGSAGKTGDNNPALTIKQGVVGQISPLDR